MPTTNLKCGQKLCLILWKNWRCERNKPRNLIFSILSPTLFFLALIILRFSIKIREVPRKIHEPIDLQESWKSSIEEFSQRKQNVERRGLDFTYNTLVPRLIIGFAPNNYETFNNIMTEAAKYLNNIEIKGFSTCEKLREQIITENYLAGACFNDKEMDWGEEGEQTYSSHLNYTLIFPGELRFYKDSFIGASWKTNTLYDDGIELKRIEQPSDGGYVGYIREGFVPLQNAISTSYIRLASNGKILPEIFIRRFPERKFEYDAMMDTVKINLSLVLMASLGYPIIYLTKIMVKEKETRLRAVMNIMGICDWMHFLVWFLQGMAFIFPSSLLLLILLKVHWNGTYAICSKSSILPLLLILLSYNIASVCFCLMMSTFFSNALKASIVTGLIWFITYVPFIAGFSETQDNHKTELALCILSNAVMGIILDRVLDFEQNSNGLHWNSLSDSDTIGSQLTVGNCILIFYVLSVLYVCTGLVVGTIKKKRRKQLDKLETDFDKRLTISPIKTKVFEVEPESKKATVQIRHLTKIQKDFIVEDISLNLFENDITVLMGPNGCGKTILIEMIIGLIKPTYGTITIDSHDTQSHTENAYSNLGIFIGDNVLFDYLTVAEQIKFFSRIKGMDEFLAEMDIKKYMIAMQLQDKRDTLTKNLPFGLRRSLAVCCALAGDSKVVVMDGPTASMDLFARKLFWQMLKNEKVGRSVLITTHSAEEADLLADHAALIIDGKLQCSGSTFFLKTIYAQGYDLICVKGQYCDEAKVTNLIRKFIPTIKLKYTNRKEISYILENKYSELIDDLLSELDKSYHQLDLDSYSISEPGLAQIFLQMSYAHQSKHSQSIVPARSRSQSIEKYDFLSKYEYKRLEGTQLWISHFKAIWLKRFLYDIRSRWVLAMQLLFPIIITSTFFIITSVNVQSNQESTPMTFSLWQYDHSVTLVDTLPAKTTAQQKDILQVYRDVHFWMGSQYQLIEIKNETLIDFVFKTQYENKGYYDRSYLVGISIKNDVIVAWFNNFPLHTAPLSLNLVHNALARLYLWDNNARITVTHHAVRKSIQDFEFAFSETGENMETFLNLNMTFYINFICACSVIFMVRERASHLKQLQCISGARILTFWTSEFIYHSLKIFLLSTILVLTRVAFCYSITRQLQFQSIPAYLSILVFAGMCLYPLVYLLSTLFKDPLTAYVVTTVYTFLGCSTAWIYYDILHEHYVDNPIFNRIIWSICRIFPQFSIMRALTGIHESLEFHGMCADKLLYLMSIKIDKCQSEPHCCRTLLSRIWCWDCAVIKEIVYFVILGAACGALMFIIENRYHRKFRILGCHIPDDNRSKLFEDYKRRHDDNLSFKEADEVIHERVKLFALHPSKYSEKRLICDNVNKSYGATKAISNFYLVLERSECFGLLGVSGSGRSTILRILAGDEVMSFGRVYVDGISLKDNPFKVYEKIGYCSQEDIFPAKYTGYEIMKITCLLRGVPRNMVNEICENLAKALGFYSHYNKRLSLYSSGTKRRLSCAIAMLGNTSIIYLEQPTTGIDLLGKIQLWAVFDQLSRRGKCVMLTSLNARECEQMCNRVGIILEGRLMCIGSTQQLKTKYQDGYILEAKIKYKPHKRLYISIALTRFKNFVETEFAESTLQNQIGNHFTFFIPFETTTMAQIFSRIQRDSFILNIEHFRISRSPLSSTFMELVEKKRPFS